mgnify:CR=1 FL=1
MPGSIVLIQLVRRISCGIRRLKRLYRLALSGCKVCIYNIECSLVSSSSISSG